MTIIEPDDWVYLDTSVMIHIEHALDGVWTPPAAPTKTDELYVAAARIRLYAYGDRKWFPVVSGEVRRELASDRTGTGHSVSSTTSTAS